MRIFLFAESLRESCPETIGRNSLKANDVQERQDKNKLIDLKNLKKIVAYSLLRKQFVYYNSAI